MDGDNFYSEAIKNMVSSPSGNDVNNHPKSLLASVLDLLGRIKDINFALTITKWLAKQLGSGKMIS